MVTQMKFLNENPGFEVTLGARRFRSSLGRVGDFDHQDEIFGV